jgi:hypothetical protein
LTARTRTVWAPSLKLGGGSHRPCSPTVDRALELGSPGRRLELDRDLLLLALVFTTLGGSSEIFVRGVNAVIVTSARDPCAGTEMLPSSGTSEEPAAV